MPAPVYSTLFGGASNVAAGSSVQLAAVPAQKVWVIRFVTLLAHNANASACWVQVAGLTGGTASVIMWDTTGELSNEFFHHYDMRLVLNPGMVMTFACTQGAIDFTCSGYVLTLP